MAKTGVIYKIETPTKKIYIGKTVCLSSRLSAYRNYKCTDQPALFNSLKKYGFEAHKFDVIYEGSIEDLNQKEIEYIKLYNSFKPHNPNYGLNLTKGGEGTLGRKTTPEQKNILRKKLTGGKRSDKTKKLMSESAKKRSPNRTGPLSLQHKNNIKKACKNRNIHQNWKYTENRIEKYGYIQQFNLEGKLVKEWVPNFKLIGETLKCDPSTIGQAVRSGGTLIRYNHTWKYSKHA